ncbi:DUF4190 domain-containing protein [Cellulophaga lytica]|uniref:CCC motif membrane protein n=1 Tax=Cellulophaga lytica TaxID=979 RepID=UPI0032E42FEF
MEQEKLPNGTMIIVLGVLGYLCCCLAGLGIIPSAIAYFMATKAEKIYAENPDGYDNVSQIKTGKIVALIAVILNVLMIVRWVYVIATGGLEEGMNQWQDVMDQMEAGQ